MNREEPEKEIDFYQEKINKCAKSKDYNKLFGFCNVKEDLVNRLRELSKKEDDDRMNDEAVAPLLFQTKLSKRERLEKQIEYWDIKIKEEANTQYRRNLSSYYFTRDKLAKQLEELKKMEERKYAISINTHNHVYFENVEEPLESNVTNYLITKMHHTGWRLASWNWHVWTHDDYIYDKEGTIEYWRKTLKDDPEFASVIEEAYVMDFNSVEFIKIPPLEILLNYIEENSDNFCHEKSDSMLRVNMIDFKDKTENEKILFKNRVNAFINSMNEKVTMIELETEGKFIFVLN